jgi:hypothetical protein
MADAVIETHFLKIYSYRHSEVRHCTLSRLRYSAG